MTVFCAIKFQNFREMTFEDWKIDETELIYTESVEVKVYVKVSICNVLNSERMS